MTAIDLTVATNRYEHTRALEDGTVAFDGVDAHWHSPELISDVFVGMVRDHTYDVAELGLTFYLRTLELDDPPFVAIPVFPNRNFRHSAIFVNTRAGIERPEDLAGKTIGEFGIYGHDAGVWPKGILADDYGVTPDQCRWLIGATDWPMAPFDFVPAPHPESVSVQASPGNAPLSPMLESGEIDALITARVPRPYTEGSPSIARLFPDHETVERDWYRRTGIFPIMHTIVVRRELLAAHSDLARSLYRGFTEAKDAALARQRGEWFEQHMSATLPWTTPLYERTRGLMGDDWWPYGIGANHTALDTYLRYFHEQGLSSRRRTVEELFAPGLLDT